MATLSKVGIVAWIGALSMSAYFWVYVPSLQRFGPTRCPRIRAVAAPRSIYRVRLLYRYIDEMREIPAGTFRMGSNSSSCMSQPVHTVTVNKFVMGRTPVTVGMWKEYSAASKIDMPAPPPWGWHDDHPMVNVSWDEIAGADGFCSWVKRETGIAVTLPSEAQFEYVARGGYEGNDYPWGNKFDEQKLWFSNSVKRNMTAPVNRQHNLFVNKYGVSEMCGNVFEWCSDPFMSYEIKHPTKKENGLEYTPSKYVFRGAGFNKSDIEDANVGNRYARFPWRWEHNLGFRLCMNELP